MLAAAGMCERKVRRDGLRIVGDVWIVSKGAKRGFRRPSGALAVYALGGVSERIARKPACSKW